MLLDNVHVTYRLYGDRRRPSPREIVASGFRPKPSREVHAVRGASLEVFEGQAIGVIGRNGSGKSSLLRAMAGLIPVRKGAVYARSRPILLGVNEALNRNLSGRHNVFLGGTAVGMNRDEVRARFNEIVEFAGLRDFIDLPLRAYSSGMRARLQFAIASSLSPDLLLIDEALAVGDAEFRERSNQRIGELLAAAGSVFVVSHALDYLRGLCGRVVWVEEGQIIRDGEPADVIDAYVTSVKAVHPT